MLQLITRENWPSTTWEKLPVGASWLTVRRAPVSFVALRERGRGDEFGVRAYVGRPVPLDPKQEYEWRNLGDPTIDLFTDPTSMVAPFTWTDRRTELVLSTCPIPGGVVAFGFRCQNATPAGVTVNPVRHSTDGLRVAAVTWAADGTITFVISALFDPLSPAVGTNEVRVFKALGANVPRIFPFALAGTHQDVDDNAVAIVGRAGLAAGMLQSIVFPVTTTPIVSCRFRGRVE